MVPCTSRRTLRTESQKDIEEILKGKLTTIVEEPELFNCLTPPPRHILVIKKGRKVQLKINKIGMQTFLPHFSLRDSFALFITSFAPKASFGGLLL